MDHGGILALDTPAALKASVGADTIVTVQANRRRCTPGQLERESRGDAEHACSKAAWSHARARSGSLPPIVTAAEALVSRSSDLSLTEPTLETVFINLTGRSYANDGHD